MKNRLIALTLLIFSSLSYSQNSSIEGVLKISLSNTGAIVKNNNVSGYFFFYKVDKVDKQNNLYKIQILDPNLNVTATKEMVENKNILLKEASYDGNAICMKFFDPKNKKIVYKLFDNSANQINEIELTGLSKIQTMVESMTPKDDQNTSKTVFDLDNGNGFVTYSSVSGKKNGYKIKYISSVDKKTWEYTSDETSPMHEYPNFLSYGNGIIYSLVMKNKSVMSKDFDYYVVGNDLKTGKKLFEIETEDDKYQYMYYSAFYDEKSKKNYMYGLYFNKDDKLIKAKSLGLTIQAIDESGKLSEKKFISWQNEVSKFLPVNAKGKIEDVGYLYFHKFFRANDGKIYAVSEQYKKNLSGMSVVNTAMNQNSAPAARMVVEDLVVFQLNDKYDLENVHIFDKTKSKIELFEGSAMMSPQLLAHYIKAYNGFDYAFVQVNPTKKNFTIAYIDYEREEGKKGKVLKFNAQTNTGDGKFIQDKISLQTDASSLKVYPGKQGYVMFLEYYRKEKKLNMRLEKINY